MPTLCIFSIALFRINCYNIFNTLSVCILRKKVIHMLDFNIVHYSTNNEHQLFAFVLYLFICWDWFFRFLHRGYLGMEKKT